MKAGLEMRASDIPADRLAAIARRSKPGASGCLIWQGYLTRTGYAQATIRLVGREKRPVLVHRLMAAAYHGIVPAGAVVRHTCDTPSCINPRHLVVGTQAENMADMTERGRHARGSNHGHAKLTEATAREVVSRYASGERIVRIAESFGVNRTVVHQVLSGKTWSHATGIRRPA